MASLYSATMVELGCSREQNCARSIAGLGSRSQGDLEAAINSRFIQVFVIFDRLLLSFVSVEQLFTADTWHIGDCFSDVWPYLRFLLQDTLSRLCHVFVILCCSSKLRSFRSRGLARPRPLVEPHAAIADGQGLSFRLVYDVQTVKYVYSIFYRIFIFVQICSNMFNLSESVSRESANFSRLGSSMLLDAMLLDATGCYWMLLDATGCYWMLLDATGCYWMLLARSWSWKAVCRRSMFKNLRKALAWRALLGLSGFMKAALGMWTKMRKNIGLRLPHLATWSRVERMHGPGWSFKEHFWLTDEHVRPKQRLSRFVHDHSKPWPFNTLLVIDLRKNLRLIFNRYCWHSSVKIAESVSV